MHNIPDTRISFIGQKGIPKDFPGTSGIEAYVEHRMLSFVREGKTIRSYGRRWISRKRNKKYKGIELITIPTINTKFLDTLTYSLLASMHASVSDSSVIWYQGIGPSVFAILPKLFGKKIYTTVHSLDWKRKKWNVLGRIFLFLCENIAVRVSDELFVVSTALQHYYSTQYNVSAIVDKHTIVPQRPISPKIIKKKYNLRKHGYILYMGRFVPEKRLEWLIRAVSELTNITIVLAGGSSHSEEYVRYLHALPQKKNILYVGYVFGREKAELLSNCKLFVLPSMLEGFPIVITEALQYGRTCLVGDFLQHEYPSNSLVIYYKSGSYKDFSFQLLRLINTIS